MGKKYDYDYIVIGSGPAGSAAALSLAGGRRRVALIEGRFFGGTNLNTLDVPSRTAFDFAHTYTRIKSFPELKNQDLNYNLPTINARELNTVIEVGGNNKKVYENAGITCIKGYASFLDNHTVAVDEKKYTATYFVLATGAQLKVIEIAGTDVIKYYSPETAIKVRRLPKVVAVVGGGSTGCEIAEYYSELGAKTILFESAERLLPREDSEAGETIANYFVQELGINVLLNSKVVALEQDEFSKRVIFRQDNIEKMVRVEAIVLATGSQPVIDYCLEDAGVKYKNSGIVVDKYFATSAKNIYAAGDCIGGESSTDRATQEGLTVASNLLGGAKTAVNYNGFARITKTSPEVATVGLNEDDLLKRDRKYKKAIVKLSEITASKIYNCDYGFVKLLADKNDHIIGATIVAPDAELMIEELAIAIRHNIAAIEIASTPHVTNNFNFAIKLAAKELVSKKR